MTSVVDLIDFFDHQTALVYKHVFNITNIRQR